MSNHRFRISTLLRHHISGTPQVANNYYGTIKDSQRYLYKTPDDFGYLSLAVTDIDTFGITDLRPSVRDGEAWQHIVTSHLDPYFNFNLNTEATEGNLLAEKLRQAGCEGDCEFARADTPESFIRLTLATIEIKFPGGLGGDLGDQDFRNLISARGQILYYNYRRLNDIHEEEVGTGIRWVVGFAIVAAGLMVARTLADAIIDPRLPLHNWLPQLAGMSRDGIEQSGLGGLIAIAVLAIPILGYVGNTLVHHLQKAHGRFVHATEAANATIFRCAQRRQDSLSRTADAIIAELSLGRGSRSGEKSRLWANESSRWTELLLWFQGRISGNHAFFLASAMMNQMVEPTIRSKAQTDAATRSAGGITVFGLAGLVGAIAILVRIFACHATWSWVDIAFVVLMIVLGFAGRWMLHRRVAYLEPETIYEIMQSHAFAGLKGASEAQIPAKLARLIRQDRNRQLYESHVHVWPKHGMEDFEDGDEGQ